MEFVAGVTHVLHTPLTAIRAAGENLADGLVAAAAQVRRDGVLIESEGRRLSSTVAHLLELPAFNRGARAYRFEPVDVGEVVDSALRESRWLLEAAAITIERDLPDSLPHVLADAGALRRGLQNLIENAVKYGGEARWLAVRARAAAGGDRHRAQLSAEQLAKLDKLTKERAARGGHAMGGHGPCAAWSFGD